MNYDDDFLPPPDQPSPSPFDQVPAPKSDEAGLAAPELPSAGGSEPRPSSAPAAPGVPPTDQSAPPDASDSPEQQESRTRNGKVARLPKHLRDQVCQMLLDGFPYHKVIESLGDAGKLLNEDNMKNWKAGGYKDWLVELRTSEALSATRDAAIGLVNQNAGATVQDAGRAIAGAQLYELLLSFDPADFAKALADKPELYLRLINSLSRLSEGETACARNRVKPILPSAATPQSSGDAPKVVNAETLKEIARLIKLL